MQEHPTDYPQWEDRVMTGSAGQASLFSLVWAQEKGMKGVQGRRQRIQGAQPVIQVGFHFETGA